MVSWAPDSHEADGEHADQPQALLQRQLKSVHEGDRQHEDDEIAEQVESAQPDVEDSDVAAGSQGRVPVSRIRSTDQEGLENASRVG